MTLLDELAELIAKSTGGQDGAYETAVPGVFTTRVARADEAVRHTVDRAVFCVVARGRKSITLNGERHVYDPSKYLVLSLDLPLVGEITEASPEAPFLGVSMVLDFATVGSLILDMENKPVGSCRSLFVTPMDDELLGAVIRLLKVAARPSEVPVLVPLVQREIYYRLLQSEHRVSTRMVVQECGRSRLASSLPALHAGDGRCSRGAILR